MIPFVMLDRDKLIAFNHYLMDNYVSCTTWKSKVMAGDLSHNRLIAGLYEYDKHTFEQDYDDYIEEYRTSTFKDIMLKVQDVYNAIITLYEG